MCWPSMCSRCVGWASWLDQGLIPGTRASGVHTGCSLSLQSSYPRCPHGSRPPRCHLSLRPTPLSEPGCCPLQPQTPSVQFSPVAQLCPTLCKPRGCSMPGFPVHHQLPEFTQTHVHCISDAVQPSHPLSSPSPPACTHSQHQGLFK